MEGKDQEEPFLQRGSGPLDGRPAEEAREKFRRLPITAEARLRALYMANPAVVYSYEPRGKHSATFVSENVKAHWGYSPAEVLEHPRFWIEHVHPEDRERVQEGLGRLFDQEPLVVFYRFQHKDGTYRWVRDERRVLRDADGEPLEVLGFWLDVDDQKRAEEVLKEQLIFLQTLIDTIPSPIYYKDRDGRFLGCNKALEEFIGFDKPAIVGKTAHDVAPRELADRYREKDLELLSTGGTQRYEASVRHADQSIHDVILHRATFSAGDKAVAGLVGVMTDITDYRRMEKAMDREQRRLFSLLDELPGFVYLRDMEYSIRFANRCFKEHFGDPAGKRCFEAVLGRREPCRSCPTVEILDTKSTQKWEFRSRLNGLTYQMHAYPFMDIDGSASVLVMGIDITERKQAEEVLRVSEERYRSVVENANEGIYVIQDGQFKFGNRKSAELTGYSKRELAVMYFMEVVHPDDRGMILENYQKRLRGEELPPAYLFRIVHKSGEVRWLQISAVCIQWEGRIATLNFVSDITERKQAEEMLRASEERYRSVVRYANEGIFVLQDGTFKFGNRKSVEMTGYSRAELARVHFTELVYPDDTEIVVGKYLQSLRSEEPPQVFPLRMVRKSGEVRWLEMNVVSIQWEGRPGVLCFIIDITERRQVEERIFRQTALLEAINKIFRETLSCETEEDVAKKCLAVAQELTGSRFGFIGELNARGRLDTTAMSDPGWEACRMPRSEAVRIVNDMEPRGIWGEVVRTGSSLIVNEPAGHPARVGLPPGHPDLSCFLGVPFRYAGGTGGMIALANKESGYTAEDQEALENLSVAFVEALHRKRAQEDLRKHRDQLETLVDQRTLELRMANEELLRGIQRRKETEEKIWKLNEELEERVRERTRELEEAYEKLRDLDRMKDSFLSSVSHELRTPLTSIRSFSEILLQYRDVDSEEYKEFLGIINSESERLTRLINDLLDLSRIEAGGMIWHDGLFSLEEVIRNTARVQSRLLDDRSLRLVLDIPPGLPPVFADRDRIQQVLTNLMNNAIKFSFRGGEIRIRAETFAGKRSGEPDEWVRVSVSDMGMGVDEKDAEIIFSRFRQGSCDSLIDKPKGTGLGLPICREIVSHYGGQLQVESRKGEGSTFFFTLPSHPREPAAEKDTPAGRKGIPAPARQTG